MTPDTAQPDAALPDNADPTSVSSGSLAEAVGATASGLQDDVLGHRGERRQTAARARLSVLRRSAGYTPEEQPLAWQTVLDALTPALPERLLGHGDSASPSERAAFDAITLFSLHMQSAAAPMHVRGRSFGTAVGMLVQRTESGSLKPRFDALLAARDQRSRLIHARSLVTLLRGAAIGLDYGRFAADQRDLAGTRRPGVLLRWGRDFVTGPQRERSSADKTSDNS